MIITGTLSPFEDDDEPSLACECGKLLLLGGVIAAIVLLNREIGAALVTTKSWLLKHVPLYAFIIAFLGIQGLRRLFFPLYYCVPVGLLSVFYLVSRVGWIRGALIYQALQLADIVWFVVIGRWYSRAAAALPGATRVSKFVSPKDRAQRWVRVGSPGGAVEPEKSTRAHGA